MNYNYFCHSEAFVLASIDHFIWDIYFNHYPDQEVFKQVLLDLIISFKPIYQDDLYYHWTIEIFRQVIHLVDKMLRQQGSMGYDDVLKLDSNCIWHLQHFISEEVAQQSQKQMTIQRQEQFNQQKLEDYLTKLTGHYARLLFVRVDLSIYPEFQHLYGIKAFLECLEIMRSRIANQDTCFQKLQGYAWALEQGITKGYHCHLLLIYDGNDHKSGFGLGQLVGQCWSEITGRAGYSFNCNSPEYMAQFEAMGTLGIGMIHRDIPQQVMNAIQTANYLVNPEKELQYLRAKTTPQMRTFGTGIFNVGWRRGI